MPAWRLFLVFRCRIRENDDLLYLILSLVSSATLLGLHIDGSVAVKINFERQGRATSEIKLADTASFRLYKEQNEG